MLHHRGNEGKPARDRWHSFRARARREAFSASEFSPIERAEFDLDADDPRSAGITGRDNPQTYDGDGREVDRIAGSPDPSSRVESPVHGPNPHRRRDRLLDIVEGR